MATLVRREEIDNTEVNTLLATVTGINGKNTGVTTLYTTPSANKCVITRIDLHITSASSITVVAALSIGQNSATYNDIVVATTLTGFNALDQIYRMSPSGVFVSVPSSTAIKLNITVGATATTMTFDAIIHGYLI